MQFLEKLRKYNCLSISFIFLLFLIPGSSEGQNSSLDFEISWYSDPVSGTRDFHQSSSVSNPDEVKKWIRTIKIPQGKTIQKINFNLTKEAPSAAILSSQVLKKIKNSYSISYTTSMQRGLNYMVLTVVPYRFQNGQLFELKNFTLLPEYSSIVLPATYKKPVFAANSVLASGTWVKVGTTQNGIHKIDYTTLRNLGINPDQIDPRNLKIFGRGAGMLPQKNETDRIDDLKELAIQVQGESDGRFNPADYILFYGESQINQWNYDSQNKNWSFNSNLYCDTTYFFLTVSSSAGKRIQTRQQATGTDKTLTTYTNLQFYNNEKINLIKSGKIWVGEEFDKVTQYSFNVSIPNLISTEPIRLRSSVTARSFVNSSFRVKLGNSTLITHSCSYVNPGYEQPYTCGLVVDTTSFYSNSSNFNLDYFYDKPASGSVGWLDFFEIQSTAELRNTNGNFIFKDAANLGTGRKTTYQIASNRTLTVLDVTDPLEPVIIEGTFASNQYSFGIETEVVKTFAVIDGSNFLQIASSGRLANQNLHSLSIPDGFIITHPKFMSEAKRLADFHSKKDNLTIHVVNIQDIYNEFSAGCPDMCAVRDFLRMFYKKAPTPDQAPKYALFFGRASYDYKYRISPNSNYIPTYESWESFSPTGSYCSDDFLGLLDDNEGKWDSETDPAELLDIGLGRLIVTSADEATHLVNKIIAYNTSTSFGNWRNKIVFAADDGDNNGHLAHAEEIANSLLSKYPNYNIEKIYLDAYKKESTAGGARFPEAQKAINEAIEGGCLIFNYSGHGGEVGLTAERVMGIDDINNWTNGTEANGYKLPLFVTATCEFSRFDDPGRYSAGELVLLNTDGGAVALFTTVRLVYMGQNKALNEEFYLHTGFDSASQSKPPMLGDIIRLTKNGYPDRNTRNFILLGDPYLTLAYPNYKLLTTQINGTPITSFADTLKALKKFEVKGIVTDKNGVKMSSYNGVVFPTVYDKFTTYSTLGNTPPDPAVPFDMQNNVLYRGKASVINGEFTYSFIVPKDISYQFGKGKISYYAENAETDGNGFTNTILIGGTNDSVAADNKGPDITLFLNDEKFVNGGLTSQNPKLIAKLFDINGINSTGKGIGRDLMITLDNDPTKSIIVNDYYQATLNSYQSGEVSYELKNIAPGKHTLKFKAFDTYNNPSETSVEFEVKSNDKPVIANLLNYPNPFNNFTTFHFDHNLRGESMVVQIQIFTVAGKLVKTINQEYTAGGTHFDQAAWDGKDDYGDKLANGVYVYKVRLKIPGQKLVEKTEKLVILN